MKLIYSEIVSQTIEHVPQITASIIIFCCFWIASKIICTIILKVAKKTPASKRPVFELLAQSARVTTMLVGVITALGSLGYNVSALVASLGLSGFALSFAMKDTLSNTLAGILILLYQPFKIDDKIEVKGFEGNVKSVNLRYTCLTADHKKILVPNATILTNTVTIFEAGTTA